jgi:predicted regulator of Ras-like GTPase activity (Roadblock/LC7/MglB family)
MNIIDNMPADMLAVARRVAAACLAEVVGVTAVVIATIDGFDVASAFRSEQDAARIAAMASSIAAISSVVAMEAGLGAFKSVTIGTDSGFAIVQAVQRPDVELVIHVIADGDAILAQAMHRIALMARTLAKVGYAPH